MPLNLSNRDQNSGHLFYNRRLRAAITRFSVRMKHDDRKQQAAVVLSIVFVVIGCGWMALLHFMKPAGLVGQSPIVGNRDTGALYAKINDRLYPALNLTSARLATGSATGPAWVNATEIAKHPTGPMIGIPGVPDDLSVSANPVSAWSVCDTAAARGSGERPTVTAIAGSSPGWTRRSDAADTGDPRNASRPYLPDLERPARRHRSHRPASHVQPRPRPGDHPAGGDLQRAFRCHPGDRTLAIPDIPGAGDPSQFLPDSVVGRVLETRDSNGRASGFYMLLSNGVQRITGFVADLLRTADSQGVSAPQLVSPDKLVDIPQVEVLDVGFYPTARLEFIDTEANPVTCVGWQKQSTDRQATVSVVSGRGLPTPQAMDSHIVRLVRDNRDPESVEADQTLMLPGAANFAASTSGGGHVRHPRKPVLGLTAGRAVRDRVGSEHVAGLGHRPEARRPGPPADAADLRRRPGHQPGHRPARPRHHRRRGVVAPVGAADQQTAGR